jgi:hypothetical protein
VFLVNGTLLMLTMQELEADGPATNRLLRDYFGMHRFEWPEDGTIAFHLGYGDWIRLLRANGFEVEDLLEVRPPEGSTTRYLPVRDAGLVPPLAMRGGLERAQTRILLVDPGDSGSSGETEQIHVEVRHLEVLRSLEGHTQPHQFGDLTNLLVAQVLDGDRA